MDFRENPSILNGKYTILKPLGEGGMARVWLAREETFNQRLVAIKVPLDNLPPDDLHKIWRRFQREISVNQALMDKGVQHVVPVYTVEKLDEHVRLLVMKYMAGGDLAQRIRQHRQGMPVEETIRIARQVCTALAVAHRELDLVHRDIKPSNILFDEQGTAYIGDFGLALSVSTLSGAHQVTVVGTPLYMAPEQAQGNIGQLTPAADVYALGCVLFEMLTGRRYKSRRPGTRVRELRADVPEWLDEVVWRCVQKEPWDRYEDAGEVLTALEDGKKVEEQKARWAEMYEAGKTALEAGRWQEAIDALEALVTQAPEYEDAQALLERAQAEVERERAERDRQQRLSELYRKGKAALEAGRWQAAIDALETLVAEVPDYKDAQALLERSRAELKQKRARQRRLAKLYKQGKAAMEAGHWKEAINALETLVAEVPDYKDASALLGRAQAEFQAELKQKQARQRRLARLYNRGKAAMAAGRWKEAIDALETLVAEAPDYKDAQAVLTRARKEQKRARRQVTLPSRLERITSLNANRLKELGRLGMDPVNCVAYSPNGSLLASGSWDGTVRLWQVSDGKLLRAPKWHEDEVMSVAFSPDSTLLASGAKDGTVCLWRAADGKLLRTRKGGARDVSSVAFSPDGTLLASGGVRDWTVRLWWVANGKLLRTLKEHTHGVHSVTFSPDGSLLALGAGNWTVQLWRVADGQFLGTLEGHTRLVRSVAFSPDGLLLASGSGDRTVRLWRVADGAPVRTLEGHIGSVASVAFSPDGSLLASGSKDKTVRLWRVADGKLLRTLEGHTRDVRSVAFSPDGTLLASGSEDGTVRLWGVPGT